jgi:hypothetical protein
MRIHEVRLSVCLCMYRAEGRVVSDVLSVRYTPSTQHEPILLRERMSGKDYDRKGSVGERSLR